MNKPMPPLVGIVIVSYNAAEAVRLTLASLRRARNVTPFKLVVIDNASEAQARSQIRSAMSSHVAEVGDSWQYIELSRNLGFSGGNNVGIRKFLDDSEVTHICLLNSDVIVTDGWLDGLIGSQSDIVSAVTNKADSEQCVPVSYQLDLASCLNHEHEQIHEEAYRLVADHAERWRAVWRGNLVETEVTFFCVLISRKAWREIGLLDETFFPGGFEDDDYCLRARDAGYKVHLARDVFIHHWGSASFGQLKYDYFADKAKRNREYLERKHRIRWRRRPEKPFISFAMDISYAIKHGLSLRERAFAVEMYIGALSKQLGYFETEFKNLTNALSASGQEIPTELKDKVGTANGYGDLVERWDRVISSIRLAMGEENSAPSLDRADEVARDIEFIAEGIHERVNSNFAIHAVLYPSVTTSRREWPFVRAFRGTSAYIALRKVLWVLRRGLSFLLNFDGIVFFGGYFYPERQSDGYFQRIQIVDNLFKNHWRLYVESDELKGRNIWFDIPEPKVLVLRISGGKRRRIAVRLMALMAVLRSRKIYFHSVLRMYDNRFSKLLRLPFIKAVVDIHGVVPEEFRMHNDFYSALIYEKEEGTAVNRAGLVVVVTEAMHDYLRNKFRQVLKAGVTCFPMFPNMSATTAVRPLVEGRPVVVYAGGLHKWQQVEKMVDAIVKTADNCRHHFYCPQPQVVRGMLPSRLADAVVVDSKSHGELVDLYATCHYGFILREDIIVNRVACPTKLVEYLAMGIVPIVDSADIGDFRSLGYRFLSLQDFLAGNLPSEDDRVEMAKANFGVYQRLKEVREAGARDIYDFFF